MSHRISKIVCAVVALSQLILGVAFLFDSPMMLTTMGIDLPSPGMNYIFAMLSARFLVYGLAMLWIMRDLPRHRLWLDGMIIIQAIDLAAGLTYCSQGLVPWGSALFPMANAALFMVALLVFRPRGQFTHA